MDPIIWQPIPGYENSYLINNLGDIKTLERTIKHSRGSRHVKEGLRAKRVTKEGYYQLPLCTNGKRKDEYCHRLVAKVFIPNPENKSFVNHINGNKLDNRVENLEWVTHSENILHAFKFGLLKATHGLKSRPVINKCTQKIYPSVAAACKDTPYSYQHFFRILKGISKNVTCMELVAA